MPQMNKGGKFIFGKSLIRTDGTLRIPPQAMEEYHIADEGKVYLFTGSKITGGFCVTRKGLLHPSKLGHILDDTPPLLDYSAGSGEFIKYKGRSDYMISLYKFCNLSISDFALSSVTCVYKSSVIAME